MSRRITRRRHRPARTSAAIILTPPAGIMIGLTVLAIARHPLAAVIIFVFILTVAAFIGRTVSDRRHSARTAPHRRRTGSGTARTTRPPRPRTAPQDARARRNGWAPPADANAVMAISEECADGACVLCPGTGCYCPCQHDSYVIAAMNTARASQAAPQTAPAAETPPF